eukprot:TRINITY_DN2227_c3_g1_i1.p2 TRINITY_DN2227_c3_g1~~TRINITY_DN2227_c3_g1_i1.p2  ORF type:complete len:225 (+),score=49.11 TRINITY_DN2227_c3_g1_i1:81-755(+)
MAAAAGTPATPATPPSSPVDPMQQLFEKKLSEAEFREWYLAYCRRSSGAQGSATPSTPVQTAAQPAPEPAPAEARARPAPQAAGGQAAAAGGNGMAERLASWTGLVLKTLLASYILTSDGEFGTTFFITFVVLILLHNMQNLDFIRNVVLVRNPRQGGPAAEQAAGDAAGADAAAPDAGTGAAAAPPAAPRQPTEPSTFSTARKLVVVFFESLLPSWNLRQLDE